MKHPQYLSETDKYHLSIDDFHSLFEKYIFSAIYNLYENGAQNITEFDIDNYLNIHKEAKVIFEKNNGIEYLQDALDFSQPDNFPFYYKRLKKFNCLEDLKKLGYNTSYLYEENLANPKAKEINDRFEELEINQIFDIVKKKLMKLETEYGTGDASETKEATSGILELIKDLQKRPEVGSPLQGIIFNTVSRGARASKFYIRSASSGTGKTRAALGDACGLAYPMRFNTENWRWEWTGSCEKTLFIATEQELGEVQTLILAYLTGINEEKILYGNYNEEEYKIILQAIEVMEKYKDNLFVVRIANPSIEQIKSVIRQNWIVHNISNVFYDYIFSSPSLLNEFRDLKIREDIALMMLSTALKDMAVEMNLFIMSSTQTNAKAEEDNRLMKNENVIRGSRAIIDKCDLACVISRVTKEEEELLESVINSIGIVPNQVMDIYKVRRGRYTNVRIWSYVDLGTCRKKDLFITNDKMNVIEDFEPIAFDFETDSEEILSFIDKLNDRIEKTDISTYEAATLKKNTESLVEEKIEQAVEQVKKIKNKEQIIEENDSDVPWYSDEELERRSIEDFKKEKEEKEVEESLIFDFSDLL